MSNASHSNVNHFNAASYSGRIGPMGVEQVFDRRHDDVKNRFTFFSGGQGRLSPDAALGDSVEWNAADGRPARQQVGLQYGRARADAVIDDGLAIHELRP